MLFLTRAILAAAGFEYDHIEETWVVPDPLRPMVRIECDEGGTYVGEAMQEVQAVLEDNNCTCNGFVLDGRYLAVRGLKTRRPTAA